MPNFCRKKPIHRGDIAIFQFFKMAAAAIKIFEIDTFFG